MPDPVTGSIVLGAGSLYQADRQQSAAEDAADAQAAGVRAAQQQTIEGTNRARGVAMGDPSYYAEYIPRPSPLSEISQFIGPDGQSDPATDIANQTIQQINTNRQQDFRDQAIDAAGVDPRTSLQSGIQGQMAFSNQGFGQAQDVLSPLSQMAQPYLQEQQNLLGFGGEDARQSALSRVSDPLVAEQERAMLRNNAALGGVGGNLLSSLAEQTRARTEANIGNRLGQLSSAMSPSLNALQQISNLRLNQGLSMADIMGGGGRDLAQQETARRQSLANLELGQGSELAQLSQNLGTAQAGGAAFAAQNPSPLAAGLNTGINTFMGAGGTFGQQRPQLPVINANDIQF